MRRAQSIPVLVLGVVAVALLSTRMMAQGADEEPIDLDGEMRWMVVELESAGDFQLTGDQLGEVLLNAGWPEDEQRAAARVAGCESGWHPEAVGHAGELGLFQIHEVHLAAGGPEERRLLMDPLVNARVALLIWQQQGWAPWSCGWAAAG